MHPDLQSVRQDHLDTKALGLARIIRASSIYHCIPNLPHWHFRWVSTVLAGLADMSDYFIFILSVFTIHYYRLRDVSSRNIARWWHEIPHHIDTSPNMGKVQLKLWLLLGNSSVSLLMKPRGASPISLGNYG